MTSPITSITLSEWQTQTVNRFLDGARITHRVAKQLVDSKLLGLTELRHGLEVKAFSYVGRVRIGDLSITILPKLKGPSLLSLLRYAYGFRKLKLISDSTHLVDQCGFEDLLISQLNSEVHELISRGLQRSYILTRDRLSSPRGRIDLGRIALDAGTITSTLPCQHHPRVEDTILNQVLMAGLRLAGSIASQIELRRESRRLASLMEELVSPIRLNGHTLDRATPQINRLTAAYAPAISIIRMLVEAQGVVLDGKSNSTTLPGFLFDMNAFFQALLLRFLKENLPGYSIRDEHGLKEMMRYNSKFNPRRRKSPTPRPDYVVMQKGVICSILDAKYRDLWEKPLPREMLYQLVVYAISQRSSPRSSILYPTTNPLAKEARIDVTDPLLGKPLGQVSLRPVLLSNIEELVNQHSAQAARARSEFAKLLAFGESI